MNPPALSISKAHRADMRNDFVHRVEGIDNILYELSQRGLAYLDDTLRVVRVLDLFRRRHL